MFQVVIRGIIAGTLFLGAASNPANLGGLMFQTMFSFNLYTMGIAFKQFQVRPIFYKERDSTFYPAWTYAVARNVSSSANALMDSVIYGTMVYFLAGFAYNDGASIGNFFMFLLLLFTSTFASGIIFGLFSAGGIRELHTAKASVVFCEWV